MPCSPPSKARVGVGSRRSLELREHSEVSSVHITPEEARLLSRSGAGLSLAPAGPDTYDLRASHHVGTVELDALRVVIRPKVGVRRLMHLLGFAPDLARFGSAGQLDDTTDLLDAMADLYCEALDRATGLGPISGYRPVHDDLAHVRGRIDASELWLRRFGVVPPVACTFDEYDADTEPNQRLLAAALLLARGGQRTSVDGLRRVVRRFEGVTAVRYEPAMLRPVRLDRRHRRYAVVLPLAELVLRHGSIELADGRAASLAMLVDMNALYERFVVASVGRALGLGPPRWAHHPAGHTLDLARELRITPDAVWRDAAGRTRLLLDAKYKASATPSPADIYQVVAYCTALGATEGILVYPGAVAAVHLIRRSGICVHVVRLELDGDVADLERAVARVAAYIRAVLGDQSSDQRNAGLFLSS